MVRATSWVAGDGSGCSRLDEVLWMSTCDMQERVHGRKNKGHVA